MDKQNGNNSPSANKNAASGKVIKKTFRGIVVSDKMDKTVVVKVEAVKMHPLYGKRVVRSKKYKVHDEANSVKEGDAVEFTECRPYSKEKRWRIVKK
jgi:small subunit ribosomal protein S17